MGIEIKGVVTSKIGFATHQNAVPVLRELEIISTESTPVENLVLQLSANPPFVEPKTWRFDTLSAGSTVHLTDRDIKLNAGLLNDLTESISGDIELRLSVGDGQQVLAQNHFKVELLARNQWGGCGSMPEQLPAFCMPNDPAVDRILKGASDVLRRAGKTNNIDGYKERSRSRVWELASAIWSSVAGLELSYALPPASFEDSGQKVRSPSAILGGRMATCLDTALLFAAALEQSGLNPLIVITKGHAFTGVWLQPQEFSQLITEEAAAVRKRIELQELIVFETTLVTGGSPAGFGKAVDHGRRLLTDEEFQMVVDIQRARIQRIRPLSLPGSTPPVTDADTAPPVSEALEEAPVLPGFDVVEPEEALTPNDRVALWQRKLLDLTTRNRLLHLPETGKCIPLVCPEPATLEDRLSAGKQVRIVAMPDLEAGGRDPALYAQQNRESLQEQVARDVLERGEVLSTLPKTKLEAELVDLFRKARSDLDEGGANTLFLAMGFLKWKKTASDPRTYRAPLILLPVKLERKSALSGVTMIAHEDEARFNLTLLELLRQDFELHIPGLDGHLPTDESGVDVVRVWNTVRQAVRDIPGFEVSQELVLGTFSFAKYLMWKDLVDRRDQLIKSPVVRHLMERATDSFSSGGSFPRVTELDQTIDPANLFTPLPADSSQLAAIVASANGCNFVLDGPPGTGKSQTIANMIAHNLALGRRVLFVAEKIAALDVVHRRLKERGLGEFCLELHSNKTSKVDVLKQLDRAWETRDGLSDSEWTREAAEVRRLRNALNAMVTLLHRRHPNGMSLHQAIGRVMRDATDSTPRLSWPPGTIHDAAALSRFRDVARRLDLNLAAASSVPGSFAPIQRTEWSNAWQESMLAAARDLPGRLDVLLAARDAFVTASSLPMQADEQADIERLAALGESMARSHGMDVSFAFAPDYADRVSGTKKALALLNEYRQLESGLSLPYAAEAARRINTARLDADWAAAERKFWFLASFAKKKVRQILAEQGGVSGLPDVQADSPKLQRMKAVLDALNALAPMLNGMPGWGQLNSDTAKISETLEHAERLRGDISALAATPDHLAELRGKVRMLVVEANELLAAGGKVAASLARLREALTRFQESSRSFRDLSGMPAEERLA